MITIKSDTLLVRRFHVVLIIAVLACSALVAQSDQAGRTIPVPVTKVEPAYTDEARAAKINGSVTLTVTIDNQGVPIELHVLKSLDPGLDQRALDAVSQWRFRPATQDGEPVAFQATIEVNFRLL